MWLKMHGFRVLCLWRSFQLLWMLKQQTNSIYRIWVIKYKRSVLFQSVVYCTVKSLRALTHLPWKQIMVLFMWVLLVFKKKLDNRKFISASALTGLSTHCTWQECIRACKSPHSAEIKYAMSHPLLPSSAMMFLTWRDRTKYDDLSMFIFIFIITFN